MLSLSDSGRLCSPKVGPRGGLYSGPLPLFVFAVPLEGVPFVPREMGIGLELDEGLRVEGGEEEPEPRRRSEGPFTVEAGAESLPAGALFDIGRTLGKPDAGCRAAGITVRVTMIRQE